jgi:hypothetical protein
MHLRKQLLVVAIVGVFVVATGSLAVAQNLLANPGFESGLTGWVAFGNAYAEAANPPQFVPRTGNGVVSMFGNWSGGFNVSGIFQEFATTPGQMWEMSSSARHWSGDAIPGVGAPNNNWVVQKIAWFDAGNVEIGGVESTILDGTFTADTWHDAATISGVAPAGTVKLQALILYLQPLFDGGAAHIDDVSLTNPTPVKTEASTWGKVKALYR